MGMVAALMSSRGVMLRSYNMLIWEVDSGLGRSLHGQKKNALLANMPCQTKNGLDKAADSFEDLQMLKQACSAQRTWSTALVHVCRGMLACS